MFDPEKAQRYLSRGKTESAVNYFNFRELPYTDEGGITWVKASDYDQLLELYREALASRASYAKGLMSMRQTAEV